MAAALPSPDYSERPRPLTVCLLPIGSTRPRLTNGESASAPPSLCRQNPALWAFVGERWAVGATTPFLASRPCFLLPEAAMPQFQTWEEFSRAAEKLYLADPMKVSRWRDGPGAGVFSSPWRGLSTSWKQSRPSGVTAPSVSFRLTRRPSEAPPATTGTAISAAADSTAACTRDY